MPADGNPLSEFVLGQLLGVLSMMASPNHDRYGNPATTHVSDDHRHCERGIVAGSLVTTSEFSPTFLFIVEYYTQQDDVGRFAWGLSDGNRQDAPAWGVKWDGRMTAREAKPASSYDEWLVADQPFTHRVCDDREAQEVTMMLVNLKLAPRTG